MIDFSAISRSSLVGKLLRLPLSFLPSHARVRILQGPLRGKRWIVGAGNHGYWLGSYESDMQRLFAAEIRPGAVIYDVGANVGFYTLLAACLTGAHGRVVAFEPLPRNLRFLEQHLALNKVENVEVIAAAVSDREGEGTFAELPDSSMGRLAAAGKVRVKTIRLDDFLERGQFPLPDLIKIDVEGAEAEVLQGGAKLLSAHRPIILLATHGDQVRTQCLELLAQLGYEVRPIGEGSETEASEVIARPMGASL